MEKEELRKLIQTTGDDTVLTALWELYELKFCKTTMTAPLTSQPQYRDWINCEKSITTTTATL